MAGGSGRPRLGFSEEAAAHAATAGIGWETDEIRLVPAPKLLELIRRSRKVSATEPAAG